MTRIIQFIQNLFQRLHYEDRCERGDCYGCPHCIDGHDYWACALKNTR